MILMMVMILTIMVMMVVVRMITITLMLILMKMIVTIKIVIMIKRTKVSFKKSTYFALVGPMVGGPKTAARWFWAPAKT